MPITSNELTKSYSGIFGNQVYLKNKNGRSVMTIPQTRSDKPLSKKQVTVRQAFSDAAKYAKKIRKEFPDLWADYVAKSGNGLTPHVVAMADYLKPPVVVAIDASSYEGKEGDMIRVEARDDFEISTVSVLIKDSNGTKIEKGLCELNGRTSRYEFIATVAVSNLTGVTITAIAEDYPSNKTKLTITL